MTTKAATNTFDQLRKAGGGIAIMKNWSGLRTLYVNGYSVFRVGEKGQEVPTNPHAHWYDRGRKVFTSFGKKGTFAQRQLQAFEEARAWVAKTYGEQGPWVRNRMGDYLPARIHKQFPLRAPKPPKGEEHPKVRGHVILTP